MPPVGPQGSRGGLITAVVIFTIGFVASTIFAIYYGVALSKSQLDLASLQTQMREVYNGAPSPRYTQLQAEAKSANLKDPTILGASMKETQDLATLVAGAPAAAKPSEALTQGRAMLDEIGKISGTTPPTNLVDAMKTLATYAQALAKDAASQRAQAVAATAQAAQQIKLAEEINTKAQQQVAEANDMKQKYLNSAQNSENSYQKNLLIQAKAAEDANQAANKQLQMKQAQIDQDEKDKVALAKQVETYKQKLTTMRNHPEENIVRRPDGAIQSVASDDICYINLGRSDHLVPGMTFEVYNKQDGIPRLGDGMSTEQLPIGLGSIEVQQVFSDSSQCRVVKLEIGQHFQQGDLIVNLVYDRNTKNNFFVYGKFDLAQNGSPVDADKDKVIGLVERWGGRVMPKINIDTDFVVMGAEPKVDTYTADQLNDPFFVRQKDDQEKAVKAYNEIRDQATKLSIPIMNQNRFLYYCGYYDAAQR